MRCFNDPAGSVSNFLETYMNNDKLRIALAEACGWSSRFTSSERAYRWFLKDDMQPFRFLPNYTDSRDAAIAAVIDLCDTSVKRIAYRRALADVVEKDKGRFDFAFSYDTATPEQICLALARALNLNVEDNQP